MGHGTGRQVRVLPKFTSVLHVLGVSPPTLLKYVALGR